MPSRKSAAGRPPLAQPSAEASTACRPTAHAHVLSPSKASQSPTGYRLEPLRARRGMSISALLPLVGSTPVQALFTPDQPVLSCRGVDVLAHRARAALVPRIGGDSRARVSLTTAGAWGASAASP